MPITVLLADDNDLIRKVIVRLVQRVPDIQILAEASGFAQTIELASKLDPQVIVLDVHMGDERAVTPEQLKSALTGFCLLAISIWNDNETKSLANSIGAVTLLDKTKLATELVPAIRNCTNNRNADLFLNSLEAVVSD